MRRGSEHGKGDETDSRETRRAYEKVWEVSQGRYVLVHPCFVLCNFSRFPMLLLCICHSKVQMEELYKNLWKGVTRSNC